MMKNAAKPTSKVHQLTNNPNAAWEELSKTYKISKLETANGVISELQGQNTMRVVCMSDTHSTTKNMEFEIPTGDIFINAGDFTKLGKEEEVAEFNTWLGTLPHTHKIVIAGNHEFSFDPSDPRSSKVRSMLTNCIYLEDSAVVINGIKIYGSPWQPEFYNWAFNLPRGEECLKKWNLIPHDTDILITHGPPVGHGDFCKSGDRAGCVELLMTVRQRLENLKYHIFGHIHEGYGVTTDGNVIFVNASTCNIKYQPVNRPIVFDIVIPSI